MTVPGGANGDSSGKIEKNISVQVLHHGSKSVVHDQRITSRVGGRNIRHILGEHSLRLGSGEGGTDPGECGLNGVSSSACLLVCLQVESPVIRASCVSDPLR